MVRKKFEEFLTIMELFLGRQGYQKSRKKGEFHRMASGKILKIRIVLNSVRNSGKFGEIRVFAALEYPGLEKIVSILKEEQYKKGNNLFSNDILQLCGDRSHYALNISSDSRMENTAVALWNQLAYSVFPIINKYEEDRKILDDFESYDTPWRYDYFSTERAIDFYLRWIALCVLCRFINEAFAVLESIPCFLGQEEEKKVIKDRLKVLCSGKEQVKSSYLLVNNYNVYINPGKAEVREGLIRLDGLRKYFLILEDSMQGNYLQIAGGSGEYTVEIRLYNSQGYVHYRAAAGNEEQGMRNIFYGRGCLNIQTCQVLSVDQAYEIACMFLSDQKLHENYNWVELLI